MAPAKNTTQTAQKKKTAKGAVETPQEEASHPLASDEVTQTAAVSPDTATDPCYEYRLVTDEDGNPVYRMVEVPCK